MKKTAAFAGSHVALPSRPPANSPVLTLPRVSNTPLLAVYCSVVQSEQLGANPLQLSGNNTGDFALLLLFRLHKNWKQTWNLLFLHEVARQATNALKFIIVL